MIAARRPPTMLSAMRKTGEAIAIVERYSLGVCLSTPYCQCLSTSAYSAPMTDTSTAQRAAVAAEVRAWMGRRRVTQAGLAAILGKSQPYVSRRLSGDVAFDTDDLFALADHFGVSVGRLLGDAVAVGSDRFRRR